MADLAIRNMSERIVEVDRIELINTLKVNREAHLENYHAALEGYKEAARKKLKEDGAKATKYLQERLQIIANAIENFDPNEAQDFEDNYVLVQQVVMTLPVPRCYVAEYDAAIDLATWDVNKTLKLKFPEFQCFVRDQWTWKTEFERVTLSYLH